MSFWDELRRRNVFKVAAAYAIVAWLVAQVATVFAPALSLPEWVTPFVVFLLLLGFPVAVVLAWAFEITPEGIKKTDRVSAEASITHLTGRKLNYAVIGMLGLAVVFFVLEDYVPTEETAATPNSLAVLPFVNLSSDGEQEHFADGLSEELMSSLARIEGLAVTGRTSSFYFKGRNEDLRTIGEALGVEHILEGSVRKDADQVRITAQLIDARSGYHVWSDTFDRRLEDIFAVQEEIARSVAEALEITLGVGDLGSRPGMTRNVKAFEAYLSALSLDIEKSIEGLESAVRIDPDFSVAWADLAGIYGRAIAGNPGAREEWSARAAEALARALELTPESPDVLEQAAFIALSGGDWVAAGRTYAALLDAAPNGVLEPRIAIGYGTFLVTAGKPRAAVRQFERVRPVEPLDTWLAQNLAEAYTSAGDIAAAIAEVDRGFAIDGPQNSFLASGLVTALASGDRALIDRRLALAVQGIGPVPGADLNEAMGGYLDDPPAARAELMRLLTGSSNHPSGYLGVLAIWAGYYGAPELALEALRRIPIEGDAWVSSWHLWRPLMRDVRRLPEFKDLVRDLGLVDYWREFGWSEFCRPVGDDFECA